MKSDFKKTVDDPTLTEIGQLIVQILLDTNSLMEIEKCGNELTKKLRVVADCLDTTKLDIEATSFPKENVFTAHHPDGEGISLSSVPNISGQGAGFEIPENQTVEEVMKHIRRLKNQINTNRESAKKKLERQAGVDLKALGVEKKTLLF